MSKRQKFLFLTWIGPGVSVIQRAKMSTDKSLMKDIIRVSCIKLWQIIILTKILLIFQNFAVELQLENMSDFDLVHFTEALNRAGGANYGTGVRDL